MLWTPALAGIVTNWMGSLPGWAMRLGSLSDFAFGLLMLWVGRRLIRAESDKENDLATSDPRATEHA